MAKIKNIEFLRIVGCLAIIFLHLYSKPRLGGIFPDIELYHHFRSMTCNGQKAVDLFFMLSGLFFVLTLDTSKSIWEFLKKKLIRLYPVLIFLLIVTFGFSCVGLVDFNFYDALLALFGVNGTGLVLWLGSGKIFWYVSSMLWVLLLFFYLLKYFDKKYVDLAIAFIVFFCYSFILHAKGGKINHNYQTFYYVFNVGMMRALGGIGIGYFIGQWYKNNLENIKNYLPSLKTKWFLSAVEILCICFIVNNLMFHNLKYKNQFVFILVFTITIILFLLNKGFVSNWLNKDIWSFFSRYTYSFYMSHTFVYSLFINTLWAKSANFVYSHPVLNVVIVLFSVCIFGLCTYHFVEVPASAYLKKLSSRNDSQLKN